MFKNTFYILFVIIGVGLVSCTETDANYKEYLVNGEIEYANKVDSIKTFNGWNRVKITGSLFNAVTVKEVVVSWNNEQNVMRFPYEKSANDLDSLSLIITGLEEKSHRFQVYSVDSQGAKSVAVDAFANAYGEVFRSNLEAKSFNATRAKADSLSVDLSISGTLERHTEFQYFDITTGEETVVTTTPEEASVVLRNADFTKTIQHRTFYVPDVLAIDEFNSDWVVYSKPQNIVNLLSNTTISPAIGGVSVSIPNPANTILNVEFTHTVNGVDRTVQIESSDNPIVMEVTGLENGQQQVYLGLNDLSQNLVVEAFQAQPIGFIDMDRSTWTIHSFKTETVNANRSWGAVNVIDDDLNTLWRSAHPTVGNSEFPQWIIIDMQEEKTMDAIKIKGVGDGKGHSVHTWEVSSDAVNFTMVGTFDMEVTTNQQINTLAAPATGRYLRYTATETGAVQTANGGSKFVDWVADIQPANFE